MKSTPVEYSVRSPTKTPNMTQRPLKISFALVHPKTLQTGSRKVLVEMDRKFQIFLPSVRLATFCARHKVAAVNTSLLHISLRTMAPLASPANYNLGVWCVAASHTQ